MNANLAKPDHVGFAIGVLMVGMITVTASDLIAKSIIPQISVWQLLALRSFFGFVFLISTLFVLKKIPTIKTINLRFVLLRSSLMSACYICFYLALAKIPIAITAGAFFCGPFFMVILSRILLGETFGIWRSLSLIGGFIGVIFILQPTSVEFSGYMILALVSAFLYALTQVVTRKYCKRENPIALSCWLTITFFATGMIGIIFLWIMPSFIGDEFVNRSSAMLASSLVLIILFLGISSIVIHYALSAAYQNAPSSILGPLEYVYLPLAVLGGYFFFDEIPNVTALVGILIIIAAGLIVAWRKDSK